MQLYEVPVIPNNLRHEETIVQIADALNYICAVFDDIITNVNSRINNSTIHLSELSKRVDISTKKISNFTGTKKATQIFSSSKYPATESHNNYKSMFCATRNKSVQYRKTKMKYNYTRLSEYPLEKLQFYHVKCNDKYKKNTFIKNEEGLGSFPCDIESINELLLFNTCKNPYKNYVMSDPLQMILHSREIDDTSVPGPDAAPLSISQRAALSRSVGENYFYSPGLGNVPTIDVPLDLPDLPGVADDLRYLMESGPGIAPSVTTTPIVPDLPSIIQSPNEIIIDLNEISVPESLPLPTLPSPSEPSPVVVEEIIDTDKKPEIIEPVTVINEVPEQPEQNPKEIVTEKSLPVIEDAHASLMAAIRKAGGKKNLRTTETKQEQKSSMSGNNLMADLNAKLALRRKGISGTKINDGSEMNSALSRVSAMIPPPPPPGELNESTNTEDEDWEE